MSNKELQVYETTTKSGSTYRFEDDGSWVDISVNGKRWGML